MCQEGQKVNGIYEGSERVNSRHAPSQTRHGTVISTRQGGHNWKQDFLASFDAEKGWLVSLV